MRDRTQFLLLIVALVLAPVLGRPVIAAEILAFAITAVANNMLLGYTGMLSFGQATFFGVGGYVAGLMMVHWNAPLWLALAGAAGGCALLAAAIGAVCVQRVGLYFIMLTFAFNQMFYFIAYSWSSLTGGEDGLAGIGRPAWLRDELRFYILVAVLFLLSLAAMKRIVDSSWGRLFRAVRDNPDRAAATGHDVRRLKLLSFVIAGGFTGLAGALYGLVYGIVPIDSIHWLRSGDIVFMTLIGGSGNFFGPVIGAAFYIWLSETVSLFWDRWPMILGIVFALVVLFLRGGIVEILTRLAGLAKRRAAA